jgi:hypothetical protein
MSIGEASDRVKRAVEAVRGEVRSAVQGLTGIAPRPILERIGRRQTVFFEEPVIPHLIKRLRSRRGA